MKIIVLLASCLSFVASGVIHGGHHQATSFQNIHMEHFHAVPSDGKKDETHYLTHPVSTGMTESKVEVHHGSKHEPGFAVAAIQSDLHGHHGGHKMIASGGTYGYDGHGNQPFEEQHAPAGYQAEYSGDEAHSQEEPNHQYSQEAPHNEDESSSYYEGHESDGHEQDGSYEHTREESAEHY